MFKRLFNWKYRYFLKKISGVDAMILDLEFKRFKTKEIREDVRTVYDGEKAKILSLQERIKSEREKKDDDKTKMPEGDVKNLEDEIVRTERDRDRHLDQIKSLDIEVHGSKPTNEYPNGFDGIDQTIDSLHELRGMLKDYLKRL